MTEGARTRWKGEQLGHRHAEGPQLKDGQMRRTPEAEGALPLPATKRVWFWVLSLPLELLLCFFVAGIYGYHTLGGPNILWG